MGKINMTTCNYCGGETARKFPILGTVTRMTEKRIVIELTEPQNVPKSKVPRKKLWSFPFKFWHEYPDNSIKNEGFCSLNCLRMFINEKIK